MRFAIGMVACVMVCSVAAAAEKMYWLGRDRGVLVLNVPDAWEDLSDAPHPGSNAPPRIQFSADENIEPFFMTVEALPPPGKGGPLTTQPAILKTLARRMCENDRSFSVEKKLDLQPIEGTAARGYWIDATEDIPDFPEFARGHSGGAVAVGNVILTFEIRRQKVSPATKFAREMLAAATIDKSPQAEAAAVAPVPEPSQRRITWHDGRWDLVFDAPGMCLAMDTASRNRETRFFSVRDSSGSRTVSVFLEPAAKPDTGDDATIVRDFYWSRQKRSLLGVEDVVQGGTKQAATLSYSISDKESHRHVYLAHAGVWVHVHASLTGFDAKAIKAMDDLIGSVRIEPHAAPATKPAAGT